MIIEENEIESFQELYLEMSDIENKNANWLKKTKSSLYNLVSFISSCTMKFPNSKFEIKTVATKNFFSDVINLMFGGAVIHHSHVSVEIVGYVPDICNRKSKENRNLIPVFAYNLFSFDLFFVVKGIRLCLWRTKLLNVRGTNLPNVQHANIGNQVTFIDTIKNHQ